MNELKPCPFCGGEAEIRALWHPKLHDTTKEVASHKYVRCCKCLASTYMFPTKDQEIKGTNATASAIEAWNRRVNDDRTRD